MSVSIVVCLFLLFASLGANAFLVWQSKANLKEPQKPAPDLNAQQILHDLTRGESLIRILRVDPNDVFLRSPRDIK